MSLEIRGVRCNCTASTRWPPLHVFMISDGNLVY